MTLQEFISKYDGKLIGYNGYVGECLSLVKQYIKELYGIKPPPSGVGSAFGYWTNFPDPLGEVFDKIDKNPQEGDIVIWGQGIGKYGHIAIYLTGDENNFTSFDQNFPVGSSCHKQNHNYKNVIGYLRPRKDDMTREQVENTVNGFYLNYYNRQAKQEEIKLHTDAIMAFQPQKYAVSEWVNKQKNEQEFQKIWGLKKDCIKEKQNLTKAWRAVETKLNDEIAGSEKRCQLKLDALSTTMSTQIATLESQAILQGQIIEKQNNVEKKCPSIKCPYDHKDIKTCWGLLIHAIFNK